MPICGGFLQIFRRANQNRFQVLEELEHIALRVLPVEENHGRDDSQWRVVVEAKHRVAYVLAVGFTKRLQYGGFDFSKGGAVGGVAEVLV